MNEIEKLGFDNWFNDKIDLSKTDDFKIVRVISVSKNSFVVSNGTKDIYAELTGKFLFNSESLMDLPAVDLGGVNWIRQAGRHNGVISFLINFNVQYK